MMDGRVSMIREIGSCGSRLVNVLFFGGTADVSLSARVYLEGMAKTQKVIDTVFSWFGDYNHCQRWAEVEVNRAKEIVEHGQKT